MPLLEPGQPMNTSDLECTACGSTMVTEYTKHKGSTDYVCEACGHRWEEYDDD